MGQMKDLTGARFGMLTVIEQAETRKTAAGHNIFMWRCKCDCGRERVVSGYSLRQGSSRSCGCVKGFAPSQTALRDRLIVGRNYEIAGQRYELLDKWEQFAQFKSQYGYVESYSYFDLATNWRHNPKEARRT
ncbi:MAG: hypothetical protein LUD72_02060 [Bacteroidales bacterium]|nr:hypothetical protein [Bacteroidales bacterium]